MTRNHIDTVATSELLGVPVQTLKQWRSQGKGPKYRKLPNGKVAYFVPDLDAFNRSCMVDPSKAA